MVKRWVKRGSSGDGVEEVAWGMEVMGWLGEGFGDEVGARGWGKWLEKCGEMLGGDEE